MAFTYFFRDYQTLEMIREFILPVIGSRRYINIWSAGCAMGQEPYTIAIMLRENMGPMIFRNVKIYCSDIDISSLFGKIIEEGSYPKQELERIPAEIFSKYFLPDPQKPGNYQISEDIRRRLVFEKHNLLDLQPIRQNMGLIVCKNVLLHFTEEERIKVFRMFYDALDDGCFLITEQTQKLPAEMGQYFEPVVANAQIFKKISVCQ
jgi:chemotaxis protein methyltransferase CheR